MKVTYFVNAMLYFEGAQTTVLCDPWVTFDRSSSSGLYNFPECGLTRDDVRSLAPDYIYITHTHADHFDPETLSLFDRSTPILVAWYENNFTERNIRNLGFTDIRVVDPVAGIPLNGDDHCWLEANAIYPDVDSLGVFRIDGQTVLNANDNPFDEAQCASLHERFGSVDLACVPFAFQGPYPAFYDNLSDAEKLAVAAEKAERNYAILHRFCETLAPKRYFPFAAGAVYGGAKALDYPFYGVGTAEDAVAYAREHGFRQDPVMMSAHNSFDLTSGICEGTYVPESHAGAHDYLEAVAKLPGMFDEGQAFWIAPEHRVDLTPVLERARQRQHEWQVRRGIESDWAFYLDVGDERLYRLSLADVSVSRVREADIADERFEIFRMPYPLLVGLLTRHFNFSNVKTQNMRFYRRPNEFQADLHILMSFLQV